MLKNYIIISIRYFQKNFLFISINIIGLAVAIALCITAYLNNKYDINWDKSHENYDDIYKVNIIKKTKRSEQEYAITPFALAPSIKQDLSGIEEVSRYATSSYPVKYSENIFNEKIGYCDPDFINIFTINIINGNKNALIQKGNILISERIAKVYFGYENPINKIVSIFNEKNDEFTFVIKGVFKNLPSNSSFSYDILTHFDNLTQMKNINNNSWDKWITATFLLIKDKQNLPFINNQLEQYISVQNAAREDWKVSKFIVKPLKEISDDHYVRANYLRSSFPSTAIIVPPIMAIIILIIASFNFINSAISFAGKRLKEIGLRKVFGGQKKHIMNQFIVENLFISLLAVVIGIFFAGYLVPEYSSMWENVDLSLSFKNDPSLIIFIILLWILTAFLAGAYPAFYISKFNPIKIFHDNLKLRGKNKLSICILGFQFFASILALFMGIAFAQNALFQERMDWGYNKNNIIVLNLQNKANYKPFEQVIKNHPKIESYSGTIHHIGLNSYKKTIIYLDQKIETDIMHIGCNYMKTMGLNIVSGQEFNERHQISDIHNDVIIVNEKLVNELDLKNPIGKTIYYNDTIPLHIIGVTKDIYLYGFWTEINPLIYRLAPENKYQIFTIKTNKENINEVNEYLRKEWAVLVPNYPYNGKFQIQLMDEAKQINTKIKVVFIFLAICALFISLIGLYTLISLSVLNYKREIGIRKVNGATIETIMWRIARPYAILIIITSIISCVVGFYSIHAIMESIWKQYITPNTINYLLPTVIIFMASAITITWKIYVAASENPVNSLKYE